MAAVAAVAKSVAGALRPEDAMVVDEQPSAEQAAEEDLYSRLKTLQRQLEFLDIQARG